MPFQFIEIKNYKKLVKEKEELELVSLIKEQKKHLDTIQTLKKQIQNLQNKIRTLYDSNFNISLVSLYNDNIEQVKEQIKDEEKKVEKIKEKIINQKVNIKNATIDFKKFEKLEELYLKKKFDLDKYNSNKELDEINSIREFHKKES